MGSRSKRVCSKLQVGCVLALLLLPASATRAADFDRYELHRDSRVADLPKDLKSASFEFWLPDDHAGKVIHGVVSVVKYQAGSLLWENSASRRNHSRYAGIPESLKQLATEKQLGIMLEYVEKRDSRRKLYKGPYQITAVRHALAYYAAKSRHPELKDAPVIWTGLSQSGGTAFKKSHRAPQQTLGAIAWHAANRDRDLAGALDVPILVPIGAKDSLVNVSMAFPPGHAASGALWTPLLQADTQHHHLVNNSDEFSIYLEWLRWLIDARVQSGSEGKGLERVDKSKGFYIVGAITSERPFRWGSIDLYPATGEVPERCMGWLPEPLLDSWLRQTEKAALGTITIHD